jgi:hypothetical protein
MLGEWYNMFGSCDDIVILSDVAIDLGGHAETLTGIRTVRTKGLVWIKPKGFVDQAFMVCNGGDRFSG